MPAKDIYHDTVRNALLKDGWHITHDPLVLKWGDKDLFIDLGAERLLAAEKNQQKIAVEIKSFTGPSDMADLERALGQYVVYHDVLAEREPERRLYLAVPEETWLELFEEPIGQLLLKNERARLLVFDPLQEEIRRWIP
ncbi:MAG: XisH family protein [Candidatus Binatia bacterium]